MEIYLICMASSLIGGLMLSRLTKLLNLPAVTAYLVAGLLIGPFCLGRLNIPGLGFQSLHQVEMMGIITQTALGFIAFTIGNEFRLSQLKTMGRSAITIGILQAVITTVVVDIILIALHLCFPTVISVPVAITLGAIASATAPAATYPSALPPPSPAARSAFWLWWWSPFWRSFSPWLWAALWAGSSTGWSSFSTPEVSV